jgi:hypothetical protein
MRSGALTVWISGCILGYIYSLREREKCEDGIGVMQDTN